MTLFPKWGRRNQKMGGLIPLCPFIKRVQYLGFLTLEKEKELGKTNGISLHGCFTKGE